MDPRQREGPTVTSTTHASPAVRSVIAIVVALLATLCLFAGACRDLTAEPSSSTVETVTSTNESVTSTELPTTTVTTAERSESRPTTTSTTEREPQTIHLDAGDNGGSVTMHVGDKLSAVFFPTIMENVHMVTIGYDAGLLERTGWYGMKSKGTERIIRWTCEVEAIGTGHDDIFVRYYHGDGTGETIWRQDVTVVE